ncbi:vacuolar membrane protease [Acrodontium crateriforme]|uniref:Peptide hydrolase n=1 Tax=Acrodontium crateriforme TaxID=150365 RepID=A0AAQ3M2D3_9PEZI|nr:vacuolar membrane protease [Acrodontium crateriforme]
MARTRSWNPIAFVPAQVTFISSAVYVALIAVLLWVHLSVPSAPRSATPQKGINLTQAWLDLDFISDGFHPIDSRRNEIVRGYLINRIGGILANNDVEYKIVGSGIDSGRAGDQSGSRPVTVFVDDTSNVTFGKDGLAQPWTCYGESSNVLVYIRGTEDIGGDWWESSARYEGPSGVLVSAHYDSVQTGYGATDDGVGVVSVLQLISYFTTEGNQPRRGIVALLNNGEENGLYGAYNYMRHPISQFPHTFLNLEGAGAGGRAMLFRSTDDEVTRFYGSSKHPFGSVVSADGFKRGFVKSSTDYSVFVDSLGMRGLDVAFFEPRARYHTDQDDSRNTSPESVWHMLSASITTMKKLTSYTGDEFEGTSDRVGRLQSGNGTDGVWFDVLGRVFATLQLHTLFALSVTLLVAAPIILIALEVVLWKNGKWYPFSRKQYLRSSDDDEAVQLGGLRGFFRFPIAFVASTTAVIALAYLLAKINPNIVYSSDYTVWAMLLCAWFSVAWFFLAGADRVRPTALQRMFCLIWMYVLTWILLVLATVGENNLHLASGYFIVILHATVAAALLISYLELFGTPSKSKYVEHVSGIANTGDNDGAWSSRPASQSSRTLLSQSRERRPQSTRNSIDTGDDEANERTSLLRGGDRRSQNTFLGIGKRRHPETDGALQETSDPILTKAYGDEQAWSSSLPQWTWILQFIILVPINVVLIGQIALILTSATAQTPADGNPALPIYIIMATMAMLILLPLTPFIHRFPYQVPSFLFAIFVGCLIYLLLTFPFSRDARLKAYFVQNVDLDNSINTVSLIGIDGYMQQIVAEIPSAAGQTMNCSLGLTTRGTTCQWHGPAPSVVPAERTKNMSKPDAPAMKEWLDYNITTYTNASQPKATFFLQGKNSKACRIMFDTPVDSVEIADAAVDPRLSTVAKDGSTLVTLFSREWAKTFKVTVTWPASTNQRLTIDGKKDSKGKDGKGSDVDDKETKLGQSGRVVCMWNDVSQPGVIPAYDELIRFMPVWSGLTKNGDGLVEGYKKWEI